MEFLVVSFWVWGLFCFVLVERVKTVDFVRQVGRRKKKKQSKTNKKGQPCEERRANLRCSAVESSDRKDTTLKKRGLCHETWAQTPDTAAKGSKRHTVDTVDVTKGVSELEPEQGFTRWLYGQRVPNGPAS